MSETTETADTLGVRIRKGWTELRSRRWVRWTMDIVFFGGLFLAISAWQQRDLVGSGQQIPDFQLETLEGGTAPLVDPEADKTLVYFWAPWCGVCSAESGTVSTAQSWLGDGVAVRSVVLDYRDLDAVAQKADGMDYPVLYGNARVREAFNIQAFPTIYVVDKDGTVRRSSMGYTTTVGLLWRAWL